MFVLVCYYSYEWITPITYTYNGGPSFTSPDMYWLKQTEGKYSWHMLCRVEQYTLHLFTGSFRRMLKKHLNWWNTSILQCTNLSKSSQFAKLYDSVFFLVDRFALPGVSSDKWILANINRTGYFRTNYDDNNWRLLQAQLNDDHEVTTNVKSILKRRKLVQINKKEREREREIN